MRLHLVRFVKTVFRRIVLPKKRDGNPSGSHSSYIGGITYNDTNIQMQRKEART